MKKFLSFLFVSLVLFGSITIVGCKKENERTIYKIQGELNQNVLTANMQVNFYNHSENAISELKFNLFANAFRKDAKFSPIAEQHKLQAYPNGISYGNMTIENVKSYATELDFVIEGEDQNILTVTLNDEIFPQERVEVSIDYTLTIANVIARTGFNDKTINLANFYPILCALDEDGFYECVYYSIGDPFYSDCSDYSVTLSYDKNYTVACSGEIEKNTEKSISFKLNNARSVAMVLSQEFCVKSATVNGINVNYYYYLDENADNSLQFATRSLSLFCEKFGQYPYSTYSVVQTKFVQGGMEFPSLVMISDGVEGLAYGEVIVHETAHQWWQTCVGNNEIEHGFLDEGLAEYSVVIFYENYPEYGYTRQNLIKASRDTFKVFCSVYDKLFGKINTAMTRSLSQFSSEYEYVNVAYIKPCIMYETLRQTVGEQRFFSALKRYYLEYCFKNAKPDDLAGVFEKVGADTNGFFKTFFEGKEII